MTTHDGTATAADLLGRVDSRESFLAFLGALLTEVKRTEPRRGENPTLEAYLEAMHRYGHATPDHERPASWRQLAEMLWAGMVVEEPS